MLKKIHWPTLAWMHVVLLLFVFHQILHQKDRFFWLSLFASTQKGEAIVEQSSQQKQLRFIRYTIDLKGIENTPDFYSHDNWNNFNYDLSSIYETLSSLKPGSKVKVYWKQPLWKEPYYVGIQDNRSIMRSNPYDFFLLLSSLLYLLMFSLGVCSLIYYWHNDETIESNLVELEDNRYHS